MPLIPDPTPRGPRRPAPFVLTVACPEMGPTDWMANFGFASPASAVYPSSNLLIGVPFVLQAPAVVRQLISMNGATASGNIDMGILDESGNLLTSAGSTAQSGTSTVQVYNVSDVALAAGTLYYVAVAMDNTTGTLYRWAPTNAGFGRMVGLVQMATAFPIPSSVTFATYAQTYMPHLAVDFGGFA